MKVKLKFIIRKILFGVKSDSKSYIAYMRKLGARIGERTVIFSPRNVLIDLTRPWLIDIGDDVQITDGVRILSHGYDWSVIKGVYGEILGSSGKVTIGNNVFIGMNTTILKGVSIGNNVIIGANSLVSRDIPNDCVVAGNPAKKIMSLDEYYQKRKKAQVEEAEELVREYRIVYEREPDEKALHEFFWLFNNKRNNLTEGWKAMMKLGGNEEESYKKLEQHMIQYKDMEEFLGSIKAKS